MFFDCIGGTSIGVILALGVVHPNVDIGDFSNILKSNGHKIFPQNSSFRKGVESSGTYVPEFMGER